MAEGSGVGGGGRSDAAKWKRGRGKWARVRVMRSVRAGGDEIRTLAAVVGKGWAKGERAIPVRGPSVAVVGTGEGKTELAGGVEGVGGEVVWEVVEARPGRDIGIRAPRT